MKRLWGWIKEFTIVEWLVIVGLALVAVSLWHPFGVGTP